MHEPGPDKQSHAESDEVAIAGLVACAQKGDSGAYDALYRRHVERIYRHLVTLLGPGGDVEDGVQEVFMHAFRKLHTFNFQSKFSTWLHGIAVRVTLNRRRSRNRRTRATAAMTSEVVAVEANRPGRRRTGEPERELVMRERVEQLHHYLDGLSEKKRVAFLLHHVEHLTVEEVARRTGTSRNTTAARIKHARRELRRQVERAQLAEERG